MSQSKTTEAKGVIKSDDLVKAENGEVVAAALNDQHLAANTQAVAADEKIEIAKKEDKDKDSRDNQNAETIQIVSEMASEQQDAQAQNDFAHVEQDMEGYSFLEGASESGSSYALGAAEAGAAGAASSGGIAATFAGLSTVAKVGLATLGAAAAVAVADDDDDDSSTGNTGGGTGGDTGGGTGGGTGGDTGGGGDANVDGILLNFEGFTDNGDGTYSGLPSNYAAFGADTGLGVVDYDDAYGASSPMLKLEKGAGAEAWAGMTLLENKGSGLYVGTDLIGDGTAAVTMKVHASDAGNLSFELEAPGVVDGNGAAIAAYTKTIALTAGWNDVSVDVSDADASVNWSKFVVRPDAGTYHFDDIHFSAAISVDDILLSGSGYTDGPDAVPTADTDAYTADNASVVDLFSAGFGADALAGATATNWSEGTMDATGDEMIFTDTNFVGIDIASADLTGMSTLKLSVYRTVDSDLTIKFVDFGGDGYQGANADTDNLATIAAAEMALNDWSTVSVDISSWTNMSDINQVVIDATEGFENFAIDDMYFIA